MLDALKQLFENNVISEEIQESIQAAWDSKLNEARSELTQQLREEFSRKYEHDKGVMIEAVDKMISDQLATEIVEFAEDRKQLAEMKVKAAKKAKQDAKMMKEFVTRQLASEVLELHEDQKVMANKFATLEKFVVEALAQEIAEFYKDKQDLAETKVRLVREGREQLAKVKEQFVQRAASMVDQVVTEGLRSEMSSLKEDIEAARRIDFGRKIFEAFASEYQTSYLNEKSETAKLLKVIDLKTAELTEAQAHVVMAQKVIESKKAEAHKLHESIERQKVMNELLAPLNKEQQNIMSELMETVKTSRLVESFDKYLPAVVAGKAPQKQKENQRQALVEAKEITGNKVSNTTRSSESDSNIIDIRRLAGLKI
jgi:hypothetical protein